MSYSDEIIEKVKAKNPNEPEFIQGVLQIGLSALRMAGLWNKEVASYDMAF